MQNYLITSNLTKFQLAGMPECRSQAGEQIGNLRSATAVGETLRFVSVETIVLSEDESWDIEIASVGLHRYRLDSWGLVEWKSLADFRPAGDFNPTQRDVRLWLDAAIANWSSGQVSFQHVDAVDGGHVALFHEKNSEAFVEICISFSDSHNAYFKLSTFWKSGDLLCGVARLPQASLLLDLVAHSVQV